MGSKIPKIPKKIPTINRKKVIHQIRSAYIIKKILLNAGKFRGVLEKF